MRARRDSRAEASSSGTTSSSTSWTRWSPCSATWWGSPCSTEARSSWPEETWGTPRRSDRNSPSTPLPEPGGPSSSTRRRSLISWTLSWSKVVVPALGPSVGAPRMMARVPRSAHAHADQPADREGRPRGEAADGELPQPGEGHGAPGEHADAGADGEQRQGGDHRGGGQGRRP